MTKRLSAGRAESVATLPSGSVTVRCAEWCRRLDAYEGKRHPAKDLYRGGHWSIMRAIATDVSRETQCFVVSAGYGLVSTEALLAPYAATFTTGHEDSVCNGRNGKNASEINIQWWNRLADWHPSGISGPRSFFEAVKCSPGSIHLLALSPLYLNAVCDDLSRARSELSDPERLIIISTGEKRQQHGVLTDNIIFAPACLQSHLGGALVSLTVRLAAEILNAIPARELSFSTAHRFVAALQSRAKPRLIPSRKPATDAEVVSFIQNATKIQDGLSYTKLLRKFRDANRACEMRRFKLLFQNTVTSRHASRNSA